MPIVTTNIRGCRQVVDDEGNGLLVELKNANELKNALIRLIESPELRHKMGKAGHEKAQRYFDENKICETVLNTYNSCMGKLL